VRCVQGTGRIRSYGKRVVSEEWATIEPWSDPTNTSAVVPGAQYSSAGFYGNSRFLTQLRTGFTITACGQTRTVNSIQSDVEMTIDRPFANGNREFIPASGSATKANALAVRGLSRTLPLWPRGVTIQVIVTKGGTISGGGGPRFKYNVWWKTFVRTDDGDGNAVDDACPSADITAAITCGMLMNASSWKNLEDMQLQQLLGVYIQWDPNTNYTAFDEWRLHVGDVKNCAWLISAEGERYINDDNANPPVCYNHGSCLAISSDAQSGADGALRPHNSGNGLISYSGNVVSSTPVRAFSSPLSDAAAFLQAWCTHACHHAAMPVHLSVYAARFLLRSLGPRQRQRDIRVHHHPLGWCHRARAGASRRPGREHVAGPARVAGAERHALRVRLGGGLPGWVVQLHHPHVRRRPPLR
jgi:hypothetical protein